MALPEPFATLLELRGSFSGAMDIDCALRRAGYVVERGAAA